MLSVNAQNATKSTVSFNPIKGINTELEKTLANVYHEMNDLNYHCFKLVDRQEIAFHQQPKLSRLNQ